MREDVKEYAKVNIVVEKGYQYLYTSFMGINGEDNQDNGNQIEKSPEQRINANWLELMGNLKDARGKVPNADTLYVLLEGFSRAYPDLCPPYQPISRNLPMNANARTSPELFNPHATGKVNGNGNHPPERGARSLSDIARALDPEQQAQEILNSEALYEDLKQTCVDECAQMYVNISHEVTKLAPRRRKVGFRSNEPKYEVYWENMIDMGGVKVPGTENPGNRFYGFRSTVLLGSENSPNPLVYNLDIDSFYDKYTPERMRGTKPEIGLQINFSDKSVSSITLRCSGYYVNSLGKILYNKGLIKGYGDQGLWRFLNKGFGGGYNRNVEGFVFHYSPPSIEVIANDESAIGKKPKRVNSSYVYEEGTSNFVGSVPTPQKDKVIQGVAYHDMEVPIAEVKKVLIEALHLIPV